MSDSSTPSIRILIVDDHPVVRFGVKHILDAEPDIDVVGDIEGLDGIEDVLARLTPDVVLLDLELGDTPGVDALRQIREIAPQLKVIVYTSHDEEDYIIQAAELGVDGYLLKGSPKEEIVGAVRNVNEGGSAIESAVAAKLMHHMTKRSSRSRDAGSGTAGGRQNQSRYRFDAVHFRVDGQVSRACDPEQAGRNKSHGGRVDSRQTGCYLAPDRRLDRPAFLCFEQRSNAFEFGRQAVQCLGEIVEALVPAGLPQRVAAVTHVRNAQFETGAFQGVALAAHRLQVALFEGGVKNLEARGRVIKEQVDELTEKFVADVTDTILAASAETAAPGSCTRLEEDILDQRRRPAFSVSSRIGLARKSSMPDTRHCSRWSADTSAVTATTTG
jgi:DNA-binding NarL/FixJ family response regulator